MESARIDPDTFRSIMASFPTGVTVVTTRDDDGAPKGFTSNAFTSVSLDPPLLLVCVALTSETLPVLRRTRQFVVNVLDNDATAISDNFARKHHDKFGGIAYETTDEGLPVLREHSVAFAECRTELEIEAGDHIVLIGRVVHGDCRETVTPLLYHQRAYPPWPAARPSYEASQNVGAAPPPPTS